MDWFSFQAIGPAGPSGGVMRAASAEEVERVLLARGWRVLHIAGRLDTAAHELLAFLAQLRLLMQAGIALPLALACARQAVTGSRLASALDDVLERLADSVNGDDHETREARRRFADALEQHADVVSPAVALAARHGAGGDGSAGLIAGLAVAHEQLGHAIESVDEIDEVRGAVRRASWSVVVAPAAVLVMLSTPAAAPGLVALAACVTCAAMASPGAAVVRCRGERAPKRRRVGQAPGWRRQLARAWPTRRLQRLAQLAAFCRAYAAFASLGLAGLDCERAAMGSSRLGEIFGRLDPAHADDLLRDDSPQVLLILGLLQAPASPRRDATLHALADELQGQLRRAGERAAAVARVVTRASLLGGALAMAVGTATKLLA